MASPFFIFQLYKSFRSKYMARSTGLKRPKYVWIALPTKSLGGIANSIVNVAEREPRESSHGVNASLDKF